jgi:predicted DNA-binding protein
MKTDSLTIQVPTEIMKRLYKLSAMTKRSRSSIVSEVLEAYLNDRERKVRANQNDHQSEDGGAEIDCEGAKESQEKRVVNSSA